MAKKAEAQNTIDQAVIDDFLDRYAELDQEAQNIMMEAMERCRRPRADQKEIREEAKAAGIRGGTFRALWNVKNAQIKLAKQASKMEDDDLAQLKDFADQMRDLPMGKWVEEMISAH